MEKVYYTGFETPLGVMWAALTDKGLVQFNLPCSKDTFMGRLSVHVKGEYIHDPDKFNELATMLDGYFEGKTEKFEIPLDLRGTPFQKRVWKAIASVPYGSLTSYSQLAVKAGSPRAVRAAGSATGANPIGLIVPCHRVIRSDGGLGGFGGGLPLKRKLLEIEGVLDKEKTKKQLKSLLLDA
jgi:O-6-methylguanine DNA methyltransferase